MWQKLIRLVVFLFTLMHFSHEKNFDVKHYLYENGYLKSSVVDPKVLKSAIEKFQENYCLTVTGNITEELIKKLSSSRCGLPSNLRITYDNYQESVIRDTFEKYITEWTDKINLKITESKSNKADIEIYFTKQDGHLKNLGYAYFPTDGDIFFDQDEEWIDFREYSHRINFGWVVGHELGHALGLTHDNDSCESIMSTIYDSDIVRPSSEDLDKLKYLYGAAELNTSLLCQPKPIDAVLKTKDIILIKGKKYWTVCNNTVQAGPFSLELEYAELPDQIDAAFSVKNAVYFFKNNVFFKFIKRKNNFVKKLISVGFEKVPDNIDAAFFDSNDNYIYFFKGSKYYIFDVYKEIGKRLITKNKEISNDWPIPDNIEAATLLDNSKVLFIKNFTCYTVDLATKELASKQSCAHFYKC
ncbi:72 kDa type IV collagenase-like [Tribolium madens]|uniref:72 kDa type IV collagenase-like n=1 Tax=Tribolium madens TaxID=41895 RepID=UPI001CF75905|nr:72 kDa type IV collagenase-like [Tribolium madens]